MGTSLSNYGCVQGPSFSIGSYTKNNNGVANEFLGDIQDNTSNLVWQDDDDVPFAMTWQDAVNYSRDKDFGQGLGWRLANINELSSLVNWTLKPTIDPIFNFVESDFYWSLYYNS